MTAILQRPGKRFTLDGDGNPVFRTCCMTREKALRFAHCLSANRRVRSAEVCRSPLAAPPLDWLVRWIPASRESGARILRWFQRDRDYKADTEGRHYQFCPDPDDPRLTYCISTSGAVYEIRGPRCNCPDYRTRCQRAGLKCKHLRALEMRGNDL